MENRIKDSETWKNRKRSMMTYGVKRVFNKGDIRTLLQFIISSYKFLYIVDDKKYGGNDVCIINTGEDCINHIRIMLMMIASNITAS